MGDEISTKKSYIKDQFLRHVEKSNSNCSNNLEKYINAGDELVRKLSFYSKGLLRRNNSTVILKPIKEAFPSISNKHSIFTVKFRKFIN